jgi:hypothetical protein
LSSSFAPTVVAVVVGAGDDAVGPSAALTATVANTAASWIVGDVTVTAIVVLLLLVDIAQR